MRHSSRLTVAALLAAAQTASAQVSSAHVRGVVRDSGGHPLSNVEVIARGSDRRVMTDAAGVFELPGAAPGRDVIVGRRVGFAADSQAVTLRAGDTVTVALMLRPQSVELDQIDVTASAAAVPSRLEGFERRRRGRSGGQFITREQIERRQSSRTTDFLRGVPGIQMVDSMGVTIAISSRGAKTNLLSRNRPVEACVVRVGVDGTIKDPMFGINLITPADIHGIEVYAGAATIPPEFNSSAGRNAQCGLIMIWTRSR